MPERKSLKAVPELFVSLVLIGILLGLFARGPYSGSDMTYSQGQVKSVGVDVYDSGLEDVQVIDWGFLDPGATAEFQGYVNNTGNCRISLSVDTRAWDPPTAGDFIFLSWDRAGYVLDPGDLVNFTFSLSVSPEIQDIEAFTFEIWVTGLEVL